MTTPAHLAECQTKGKLITTGGGARFGDVNEQQVYLYNGFCRLKGPLKNETTQISHRVSWRILTELRSCVFGFKSTWITNYLGRTCAKMFTTLSRRRCSELHYQVVRGAHVRATKEDISITYLATKSCFVSCMQSKSTKKSDFFTLCNI